MGQYEQRHQSNSEPRIGKGVTMNINELLVSWFSLPDSRSSTEIHNEIDEELQFHIETSIEEKVRQGTNREIAEKETLEQFGSVNQYSKECRLVDLGDRIMINRFLAAGVIGLSLLVGYLVFETQQMKNSQIVLLDKISEQQEDFQEIQKDQKLLLTNISSQNEVLNKLAPEKKTLSGSVSTADGKPLNNVKLLLILKTWPNNRYRQQNFHVVSNDKGIFEFDKLIPAKDQYGINITALKEGYVFKSVYQFIEHRDSESLKPINFQLNKSHKITLQILDSNGTPINGVKITPSGREKITGEKHLIYFQGSDPICLTSDVKGEVTLNYFAKGDSARLGLQKLGIKSKGIIFKIPETENRKIVKLPADIKS